MLCSAYVHVFVISSPTPVQLSQTPVGLRTPVWETLGQSIRVEGILVRQALSHVIWTLSPRFIKCVNKRNCSYVQRMENFMNDRLRQKIEISVYRRNASTTMNLTLTFIEYVLQLFKMQLQLLLNEKKSNHFIHWEHALNFNMTNVLRTAVVLIL